jgi:hypothetical protein
MRRLLPLAVLYFSLALTIPSLAQDDAYQFQSNVEIQYGVGMTLKASIHSPDPLARASVFLRPTSGENTTVLQADITPEIDHINLDVALSLQPALFYPFELVTTWWQFDFENGSSWSSPAESFRYEDTRFPWHSKLDDHIAIHWVEGGSSRGEEIYNLTRDALESIGQSLGLMAPNSIAVYVYPSSGDLQSGLLMGGAPWVKGQTLPELDVILLAASDNPESIVLLERDIPHELTHLLLYERMQNSYTHLPAWLNEGLATLQERQANPAYRFELEQAIKSNALLTMESLCASFPISENDALLAYAQSASFTQYLLDVYGMGGILQLLDAYQEGVSCKGGVQRIYQRALTQLEDEWRTLHLQSPTMWERIRPILPWGLFLLLVIILILIGFAARKDRSPNG